MRQGKLLPSVIAVAALLAFSSCDRWHLFGGGTGNCPSGKFDVDHPVICIDNTGTKLVVVQDHVTINEVLSTDKATPVEIEWVTKKDVKAGDVLTIDVRKTKGCLDNDTGSDNSSAKPKVKLHTKKRGKDQPCRYSVQLSGFTTLDPDFVITKCCITPFHK